jgi:hypothetical protein
VKRKPGRPKLPKGEAKGKIVPIRFTKAESERLAAAAKKNDQTLSEWIRRAVLAVIGDERFRSKLTRNSLRTEGEQ